MKLYNFLTLSFVFLASASSANTATSQISDIDVSAWQDGDWRFRTSLHTVHYRPKSEHNNRQKLVNLEYVRTDDWLVGGAFFYNSFGQPSQYAYVGRDWWLWSEGDWQVRATLTAGLLHGYKDEYADKIPLNDAGVAPVLLPYIGLSYKRSWFIEAQFFAAAGVMATVGYRF